eukprot:10485.XXX_98130_96869_1 [CDS] Oithona nana genome sequencing.
MSTEDDVKAWVTEYYGKILKESKDLKTNACCASGAPPKPIRKLLKNLHPEVLAKFYGCGFPFSNGLEGCTIVDLGCGAGRDVYVLSQLVGPEGHVIGVDMTAEQIEVAERTKTYHMEKFNFTNGANVTFHQGYIEDLKDIGSSTVDVVVSNCVVNLSPRKDLVMKEIFRVLKDGGEFYFSDVFVDRRLPSDIAFDPLLHSECLGGALYVRDFVTLARKTGFKDPRVLTTAPITIQNDEIEAKCGMARFTSITFRLFKIDSLDSFCEDYGQTATYLGSIDSSPSLFVLDDKHSFEVQRPERVCANTALMLSKTRYKKHFKIVGDTSVHYGSFDCSQTMAAKQYETKNALANDGCC